MLACLTWRSFLTRSVRWPSQSSYWRVALTTFITSPTICERQTQVKRVTKRISAPLRDGDHARPCPRSLKIATRAGLIATIEVGLLISKDRPAQPTEPHKPFPQTAGPGA